MNRAAFLRPMAIAFGATAVIGGAVWMTHRKPASPHPTGRHMAPKNGVDIHNTPAVTAYIAKHDKSPDKRVQDAVTRARIALAYDQAFHQKLPEARRTLLVAAKQYRGTGVSSADWGSLSDQAAYQAAVVLVAEHKPVGARAEFLRFLRERPLSPLAKVVYRRLVRLNGGRVDPEAERLTQADVAAQEKRIRFEESVCGPKALAYLLPKLGKRARGYREIAKLCGTTDSGTSIDGMRHALKTLGVSSYAFRLNRLDLSHAPLPAIYLHFDHYFVLERVNGDSADVYDPVRGTHSKVQLPPVDDRGFVADLILFSPPTLTDS